VIWAVALLLAGKCALDWRGRPPLGLGALMLGGGPRTSTSRWTTCSGLVHHPAPGLNIVLDTIGPFPDVGAAVYSIFFGAIPVSGCCVAIQDKSSLAHVLIGLLSTFFEDLVRSAAAAPTLPVLRYGDTPMTLVRFPDLLGFLNTPPVLCAACSTAVPANFTGGGAGLLRAAVPWWPFVVLISVGLPVLHRAATPRLSERPAVGSVRCCRLHRAGPAGCFGLWTCHRWSSWTAMRSPHPLHTGDSETGR